MKTTMTRPELIRAAAIKIAYGVKELGYPEPRDATPEEVCYLRAIDAFRAGRQCSGWDLIEAGETISNLDY